MKKKVIGVIFVWIVFVLCLIGTVVLWFKTNAQEVEYEEVEVTVVSAVTKQVETDVSTYDFYEITVNYQGEEVALENAHNAYSYTPGKKVKAYLYNGRFFANVEGVTSSTTLSTVYFVFLFASFGMLFIAPIYTSKVFQKKG